MKKRQGKKDLDFEQDGVYRSLFDDSPISIWLQDFSRVKDYLDRTMRHSVLSAGEHFDSNPQEVRRCAKMVRIVDVNKAGLAMYGAIDREDLTGNLNRVFIEDTYDSFKDILTTLWQGGTYEGETVNRTLRGESLPVLLKISVPPGYKSTWERVFVSVVDLTAKHTFGLEKPRHCGSLKPLGKRERSAWFPFLWPSKCSCSMA